MDDHDLQHDLRRYIEAFADGELDVETNLRVLERMAMNPQATQRVMHQQELRRLVDQAMREQAPPVPADLRNRIMAISAEAAREESNQQAQASSTKTFFQRFRFIQFRPLLAAAAMLLLVVGVYFLWLANTTSRNTPGNGNGNGTGNESQIVVTPPKTPANDGPQALLKLVGLEQPIYREDLLESRRVTAMGSRHESCSSKIENLYRADDFSTVLSEVPAKITQYLGPQIHVAKPDLAALGYEYRGTGACSLPGGKAVHLVYRPIDSTGRADSLSLWIRSDEAGQVNIEEGQLYTVTPDGSEHPVLVWRRGTAIYYLVGDRSSLMKEAAGTLYALR